jgi:hypothetical protein
MSEESLLPRAWYGKIFDVTLSGADKPKASSAGALHLMTSPSALELYSPSYDRLVQRVPTDRIAAVYAKGGSVLVSYRADGKSAPLSLRLECAKPAKLAVALQPVAAGKAHARESHAVQRILAGIPRAAEIAQQLHALCDRLLALLASQLQSNPALVDIASCLYRARFGSADPAASVALLNQELKLRLLIVWARAMLKAASLHDKGLHPEYVGRMAVHLADTIGAISESLQPQLDATKLLAATVYLYETGDPKGVLLEAERFELTAHEHFCQSKARAEATADPRIDRLYDIALLAVCARILNVYPSDVDVLRDICMEMVLARDKNVDWEQKIGESVELLISGMIGRFNDRRYDREFQYVFALWPLQGG